MRKVEKQYCINNLTALVAMKLNDEYKIKDKTKALRDFMSSKTYSLLIDVSTELWKEGPDYIICLYKEELEK